MRFAHLTAPEDLFEDFRLMDEKYGQFKRGSKG
jgi:hypothetical protein